MYYDIFVLDAHSKGLFFGVSLEASVIASRPDVNTAFYGLEIKPSVLLSGEFKRPKAAEPLYKALSEVLSGAETAAISSESTISADGRRSGARSSAHAFIDTSDIDGEYVDCVDGADEAGASIARHAQQEDALLAMGPANQEVDI